MEGTEQKVGQAIDAGVEQGKRVGRAVEE